MSYRTALAFLVIHGLMGYVLFSYSFEEVELAYMLFTVAIVLIGCVDCALVAPREERRGKKRIF